MTDLLVLQPTTFCNIDCKYCYLPDRNIKKKLTVDTLKIIINNLLSEDLIGDTITLVWHSGEPLALGKKNFQDLLECADVLLKNVKYTNAIQTNGMLINEDWCELFKAFNCHIGISIDGPKIINDKNRIYRNGKGTFDDIMKGVFFLRKFNIPYHAIAVITADVLDHPKSFFDFFYENGFYHLGLNIEEIEGVNTHSSLQYRDINNKIYSFLNQLFEIYNASDGRMKIREFDNAAQAILRRPDIIDIRKTIPYSHQLSPLEIITVDTEGNFSTFSPELIGQKSDTYNNFILGNIFKGSYKQALETSNYKLLFQEIRKGMLKCKNDCEYFLVCGGGAPANKYYENGSFNSTETMYCKYTVKIPIDIVLSYLEKTYV